MQNIKKNFFQTRSERLIIIHRKEYIMEYNISYIEKHIGRHYERGVLFFRFQSRTNRKTEPED